MRTDGPQLRQCDPVELVEQAYSDALSGSKEGAAKLHRIAASATWWLTSLCYERPELCAEIARHQVSWPVPVAPHRERQVEISKLIKKIQLGVATPFELAGAYSFFTPGTPIALKLVRLAETLRNNFLTGEWKVEDLTTPLPLGGNPTSFYFTGTKLAELTKWGRDAHRELPKLCRETVAQWKKPLRRLFRLYYPKPFIDEPELLELKNSAIQRVKSPHKPPPSPGRIETTMIAIVLQSLTGIVSMD